MGHGMDNQQLFNIVFAIAGAFGGWWMKAMWESVKGLEKADKELSSQVSDLKVLVAGGYLMDVFANVAIASLVFLEPPREWLVTNRLQRHIHKSKGWRFAEVAVPIPPDVLEARAAARASIIKE